MDLMQQISNIGIVPVIKINDAKQAVPLAKALIDGGLPVAEITFRTDAAEEAIRLVSEAYPEMIVGAGTVLTIEQAERAKNAGAKFIVSPGFNPKVVKWCVDNDILATPGCTSPSEIEQALELGLKVVKFFPAEQSGGLEKIKALSAPYGNLKFMPTGGIGLKNLTEYMSNKKIVACGGSFMVKEDYINDAQWDKITQLSKESVDIMLGLEVVHIGINNDGDEKAKQTAALLSQIINKPAERESEKGMFVGPQFEVMKSMGRGTHGHIAIGTTSVERAIYHLSKRGVEFDEASATFNADGSRKFIYLKDEVAGYAIHLVEKK